MQNRMILICPDCHHEIPVQDGNFYPLCPACAVPMREEFRPQEEDDKED